ncbi:MAG: hypothetical protein ACK5HC_12655 [Dolichospermum sp.]|nr:hypothetical protein [Anabaena sp. 49628_E55]
MTKEQGTGKRFWVTLLFVTYVGFFRSPIYLTHRLPSSFAPFLLRASARNKNRGSLTSKIPVSPSLPIYW